jgi:hypothetical protein
MADLVEQEKLRLIFRTASKIFQCPMEGSVETVGVPLSFSWRSLPFLPVKQASERTGSQRAAIT